MLPRSGYIESERQAHAADQRPGRQGHRRAAQGMEEPGIPKAKPGSGPFPYRTVVMVRRKGADVPQTLRVTLRRWQPRDRRFSGDRAWQRFAWITPSKAVSAQLDPERRITLDRNKLDDGRTLEADASVARTWTGRIGALLQSFLALLVSAMNAPIATRRRLRPAVRARRARCSGACCCGGRWRWRCRRWSPRCRCGARCRRSSPTHRRPPTSRQAATCRC